MKRYKIIKRVTLIGALVNVLQGIAKLLGGIFMNSHALVADGLHSFSDIITDIMVIIGAKYGSVSADVSHPYGHQRIETATTLFLSLLLIVAGVSISWDAFYEIIHKQQEQPDPWTLLIIVLAIFANEILFQYTNHIGTQIKSDLIIANAWHHRSDAFSSIIVFIGLLGSLFGYKSFDSIAAIIVSILIIKIGIDYAWSSLKELVDTAVDPEVLSKIEETIKEVPGVIKIHQLRSRSMASNIFIDVHIQVTPWISVSEGHYIAQSVHENLMRKYDFIRDVTVHVDPEDDEITKPSHNLPHRKFLEQTLIEPWKQHYPELDSFVIHYLNGELTVDLFFTGRVPEELTTHIDQDIKKIPHKIMVRYFISYS